jgi:hypothetical protein
VSARDPHQPMNPWHGGSYDLPDDPTDAELRRALRILTTGGALGGAALWTLACARWLRDLGPDAGDEAATAYARVSAIAKVLQPPPTGILGKAGRGLVKPTTKPHGRIGDVVPADATDEQIRELYSAGDGQSDHRVPPAAPTAPAGRPMSDRSSLCALTDRRGL